MRTSIQSWKDFYLKWIMKGEDILIIYYEDLKDPEKFDSYYKSQQIVCINTAIQRVNAYMKFYRFYTILFPSIFFAKTFVGSLHLLRSLNSFSLVFAITLQI